MMLGIGSELQLPANHTVIKVNNRYTYNHSVPTQPFCFSLLKQYSINYISYSTLYLKIGFVLYDSVQLQANVNVLSTFNVG